MIRDFALRARAGRLIPCVDKRARHQRGSFRRSTGAPSFTSAAPDPGSDTSTGTTGDTGWLTDSGDPPEPPAWECSVWLEDCAPGEKCVPWADECGVFNSTRCTPVAPDAGAPGDECSVEETGENRLDNCGLHSVCRALDPETGVGHCVAQCVGSENDASCVNTGAACHPIGVRFVCLPLCHPLTSDCYANQGCYPVGTGSFVCVEDYSGRDGAAGDACEYTNSCDPGLACAYPDPVACGMACCSPLCSVQDEDPGCPGEQVCIPWYVRGEAPRGLEDVGVCALVPRRRPG